MNKKEQKFVAEVVEFYRQSGRHDLPWRMTVDPYKIVVSEIMLQQTQVERVAPKYQVFMKAFPTARRLATAPLSKVLHVWQGLGYNRRAKMLHECAQAVISTHKGMWPSTYKELQTLPGIGPYTAGAVMAFAYNQPVAIVETNIRTVYLHHFFKDTQEVTEAEILKVVEKTLDTNNPRTWYWALMDYGAHLKRTIGNQNHRGRHYKKQSRFAGSDRQIRGAIVRLLTTKSYTIEQLCDDLPATTLKARVIEILKKLEKEGMVEQRRNQYYLPR